MILRTAIIVASARKTGHTHHIVDVLHRQSKWPVYDLLDYTIHYFDYDNAHQDDDFMPLIRELLGHYDAFVFATPVYWYTMSAPMKTFFDRITDLLLFDKPLGRQLRGKAMGVLSCANDAGIIAGFDQPFAASADYLGMTYKGHIHTWLENQSPPAVVRQSITTFIQTFRQ
jgi:multimeric flavodoxin WrbA